MHHVGMGNDKAECKARLTVFRIRKGTNNNREDRKGELVVARVGSYAGKERSIFIGL